MEIEKSRNGFYTVTFTNKANLEEEDILKEFSSVGRVCKVIRNFQRVFVRFKEKDEAERALKKFENVYDISMAKNNKISDTQQSEGGVYQNHKFFNIHTAPDLISSFQTVEKSNPSSTMFHLILGNLPKNYTMKDVRALVEEANPVCINQLEETRVFNIKFCHIVLSSTENLLYLIDKLNGFVISGEKLVAAEAKHLLEWRNKPI